MLRIFIFLLLSLPVADACVSKHRTEVVAIAQKHSWDDKNNHCSVSCLLSLRCSLTEVALAGYYKELRDVLGPGSADARDLEANRIGRDQVRYKRARTDRECLSQCDLYY